jgi:hypothetical protein
VALKARVAREPPRDGDRTPEPRGCPRPVACRSGHLRQVVGWFVDGWPALAGRWGPVYPYDHIVALFPSLINQKCDISTTMSLISCYDKTGVRLLSSTCQIIEFLFRSSDLLLVHDSMCSLERERTSRQEDIIF